MEEGGEGNTGGGGLCVLANLNGAVVLCDEVVPVLYDIPILGLLDGVGVEEGDA